MSEINREKIITSRLLRGILNKQPEFVAVYDTINSLKDKFVTKVYNQGLRSRIDRSSSKGMSGKFGKVKMMTFVTAGRVMITLECGDDQITFVADENGAPRMGLNSINATLPSAQKMVNTVITEFENELKIAYRNLKDNDKVSII